ncbi:hypothetical protein [Nocardia sp. XZ_19_369]|uniref:hypothetical protein n=1 Tax=Nocardia sp. XZ_19_369 TaxID=2769487 RepID=UPI0018904890|nr:hypothetical protein [Nocardia sp. XZ_19_369]
MSRDYARIADDYTRNTHTAAGTVFAVLAVAQQLERIASALEQVNLNAPRKARPSKA